MTESSIRSASAGRARARASRWVLAFAVLGTGLALGGLYTQVLCASTLILAIAVALAWVGAEPTRPRPVATLLLALAVGLELYTVFQCVPLPAGWIATLAPKNADVWARAYFAVHEPLPAYLTISVDPTATRVEVLRGAAYILAFLGGLRIANRAEGARFLERALIVSGVVMAVVALLHPAFGAQKVFGVYEPRAPLTDHIAPLLNTNHLAGFINIALCIAFASVISEAPLAPRPLLGAAVLLLGGSQLWVASRGGVGSMVMALTLALVLTIGRRRPARASLMSSLAMGGVLVVAMVMIVFSASDTALGELSDKSLTKLHLVREAVTTMVPQYPIFGSGRGSFESAFPEFRTSRGWVVFSHPENVVAQWAVEWGLPVAIVAFMVIGFALRPKVVLTRSHPSVGPWCALVAVGAQNMVDFSSEVPALVIPLVICASIVVAGTSGANVKASFERWARWPTGVAASAIACAALAVVLATPGIGNELVEERVAVYRSAGDPKLAEDDFHRGVRAAILRHPAEPYFPYAAAARAAWTKTESPVPWIGRTLERAPFYVPAHLLLARSLRLRSPAQARMEYRIACEQDPSTAPFVAQEAAPLIGSYEDAMEVVPAGPDGDALLDSLAVRLADRLPATRARLDLELLGRQPDSAAPTLRAALDVLADVESGDAAPWCVEDREACAKVGRVHAERIQRLRPSLCEGFLLHARLQIAAGDTKGGLAHLARATDLVSDRAECLRALAELAIVAKDEARVTDAIDKLSRATCTREEDCVRTICAAAALEERRGNAARALQLYSRAAQRSPDRDDLQELVAGRAASAGLHSMALEAYQRLASRHPAEARYKKAIADQKRAIIEQGIGRGGRR